VRLCVRVCPLKAISSTVVHLSDSGGSDVGEGERTRRQEDGSYSDYWQKQLDVEESTGAFLSAIATLIEDTLEITLQLYIILGHGVQENIVG